MGPDRDAVSEGGGGSLAGGALDRRLEALLDSFAARFAGGERLSITEFAKRDPELADRIREVFPALLLLDKIGGPSAGETGSGEDREGSNGGSQEIRRLGEYWLIREVGRGGMGIVYEAEQESLGRRVAVKVLPFHSLMDRRRLERFRREARAAGVLQHPHILPVYGFGEDGGIHYFAMQYVDGQSLDRILPEVKRITSGAEHPSAASEAGEASSTAMAIGLLSGSFEIALPGSGPPAPPPPPPLPAGAGKKRLSITYFKSAAQLAADVARALSHAHGKGVLHRDIKPSNLLLESGGKAWVADFGLAKLEGEDLTVTGEIMGTLRYMAPEQFRGLAGPSSDIYSLGLTLYELLTLEPAFREEDREQLFKKVTAEPPRSPRKIEPRIPRSLEKIVLKSIQKEPQARYRTALEMAEDLERFIGGRRVLARLPGPAYPLRRFIGRHRIAAAAAALSILLCGLAAGAMVLAHRPLLAMRVLARDFDGDGKTDLAVVNAGSRSISLARGDGKGGFAIAAHLEVGDGPLSMAAVDFDGDGHPDLAVSNYRSMDITVFRNQGDGSFARAGDHGIGARVNFLASGDMDGDGRVDLVAAGTDSRIHILRGLGGARLEEMAPIATDLIPNIPVVADLDGDGDQDVVVTCSQDRATTKMSVLNNRGDGAFQASVYYDLGKPCWGLAARDLDGDGATDLVVTQIDSDMLSILRNKGNGSFAEPMKVSIVSPDQREISSSVQWVACGDLDGNGILDLAAAGGDGGFTCILPGKGNFEFGPPRVLSAGKGPSSIEMADLDGDGKLDLAVSNFISNDVTLFFNDGKGNFGRKRALDLAPWWRPRLLSRR